LPFLLTPETGVAVAVRVTLGRKCLNRTGNAGGKVLRRFLRCLPGIPRRDGGDQLLMPRVLRAWVRDL
jgi:hypothetical protein